MGGPPPEIRNHIDSLVKALNSTAPERGRRWLRSISRRRQLKRQTVEERSQVYENVRRDFGPITLGRVEGPDQPLRLHIKGSTGATGVIELTLENDPPFKIENIAVRIGAPPATARGECRGPSVNGAMSEEQLKAALNDYLRQLAAKDVFSGDVLIGKDGNMFTRAPRGLPTDPTTCKTGPQLASMWVLSIRLLRKQPSNNS